jgi:hypothetical protein
MLSLIIRIKGSYDEILVIHNNNLSTFVPEPLLTRILWKLFAIHTKVFETDFFAFDEIKLSNEFSLYSLCKYQ